MPSYSPSRLATILALGLLTVLSLFLTPSFTPLPPLEHPVLFISRQIPCCGSVKKSWCQVPARF
ncbi:MAG: hypothetical protein R2787_06925 [Saprospiraceae bacterium]